MPTWTIKETVDVPFGRGKLTLAGASQKEQAKWKPLLSALRGQSSLTDEGIDELGAILADRARAINGKPVKLTPEDIASWSLAQLAAVWSQYVAGLDLSDEDFLSSLSVSRGHSTSGDPTARDATTTRSDGATAPTAPAG